MATGISILSTNVFIKRSMLTRITNSRVGNRFDFRTLTQFINSQKYLLLSLRFISYNQLREQTSLFNLLRM